MYWSNILQFLKDKPRVFTPVSQYLPQSVQEKLLEPINIEPLPKFNEKEVLKKAKI